MLFLYNLFFNKGGGGGGGGIVGDISYHNLRQNKSHVLQHQNSMSQLLSHKLVDQAL